MEQHNQSEHLLTENTPLPYDLNMIIADFIGGPDWYLPSKNELNKMYIYARDHNLIGRGCSGSRPGGVQCLVGGRDINIYYWSSSEYSDSTNYAWTQLFDSGGQDGYGKMYYSLGVRAVRAFNYLTIQPFNNLFLDAYGRAEVLVCINLSTVPAIEEATAAVSAAAASSVLY